MKKILTIGQNKFIREYRCGPKPFGFVSIHAEIPPEHLVVMKARNVECGGCLSVNEQIRRAILAYILDGLVYINPLNH